jgi:hypothetical protein
MRHEGIKKTALDVTKNCSAMLRLMINMMKKVTPPKLGTRCECELRSETFSNKFFNFTT